MRFFLDHDVPAEVARVLRQEGHETTELREILPADSLDTEAFQYARQNGFFMITCNHQLRLRRAGFWLSENCGPPKVHLLEAFSARGGFAKPENLGHSLTATLFPCDHTSNVSHPKTQIQE